MIRAFVFLFATLFWGTLAAQNPDLTIIPGTGPVRLHLTGQTGREHVLQGSSDLTSSNNWSELLTLTMTNGSHSWFDNALPTFASRFYRVSLPPAARPPFFAPDFQLIDQADRARHLAYFDNYRAVVLIFTGVGCTNSQASVPLVKTLRDQFEPQGVHFLLVNAMPLEDRTNIATQATGLGIDLPVLKDEGQLVARELGVRATTEAFCFNTTNWTLFYRGAIDDRLDFNSPVLATTQAYLSNAVASFLAGNVITPSRTVPQGCAIALPPGPNWDYATNVVPLLQAKCVRCHSVGNIGTWAMTNYDSVTNYALSIKNQVLTRRMPPWHADPRFGHFDNDNSLAPAEAAMLIQWINAGTPRGSGPDALATTPQATNVFPYTWPDALGTPDLVLKIPGQNIPAVGLVNYVYVNVTNTLTRDVWLRAAVVKPGQLKVVHHCLVYFGANSTLMGLDGYFAGYVPGMEPVAYPVGTGKLLPAGAVLRFQMHYTTDGQPETDQTELGLYFAATPPPAELQTKSAYDTESFLWNTFIGQLLGYRPYIIPAGASDYVANLATFTPSATKDVWLYEMSPHMHFRGARFRYEAVYPDNTRETLLSVPKYEFHWQTLYRLAQPKRLPAGTRIVCTGAFDNSAQNRDNPNPAATVSFGEQTADEMFIGYLNFSVIP